MVIIYNIFIRAYKAGIGLAAAVNPKAKRWIDGRTDLFKGLQAELQPNYSYIWFHCASAGELEQAKPVMEELKSLYPNHKILLSVFSPSGMDAARRYTVADVVTYLPLDTPANAEKFMSLVKPVLAVFIKYEFWYHHLKAVADKKIPLLLVSAVFRPGQIFFQRYGTFYKKMLPFYTRIFVQDQASLLCLTDNGITNAGVGGDTRFDRVMAIKNNFAPIPFIDAFCAGQKVIVAGSTWIADEELLAHYAKAHPDVKLIIAPHQITEAYKQRLVSQFESVVFYSTFQGKEVLSADEPLLKKTQVLMVDCTGLLSRLYQYAAVTYVGGGFTKDGIHNILEAAVWNKPVLFGPNYKKYREAAELIAAGGGWSVADAASFEKTVNRLLSDEGSLQLAGTKAGQYVAQNAGATATVLAYIQANRLLTRL